MITLKHVMINIGYAFPRPCIARLQFIAIEINGIANAKILKYPTPIFIISGSLVNKLSICLEKNKKNIE